MLQKRRRGVTDDTEDMNLEEYTSIMVAVRRKALENIKASQE